MASVITSPGKATPSLASIN